ncbi:MAG: hypothetical protein ACLTBR_03175 [Anaerostipes sp.]|uniref:hypothetical protein n=1 Tax=Anaerostipes sp. TaxID=1872530 RepID=UPI0039927A86
MEELTKKKAIASHRKMWNWIADETERSKNYVDESDYFKAMKVPDGDEPAFDSYCCEYAIQQNNGEFIGACKYCPLDWKSESDLAMCEVKEVWGDDEGLYEEWRQAHVKDNAKIAREIANLKER